MVEPPTRSPLQMLNGCTPRKTPTPCAALWAREPAKIRFLAIPIPCVELNITPQ